MTPIYLLLAGAAGAFGLALWPRARPYIRYSAPLLIGLVAALILRAGQARPMAVVFSLWQPSLLFGTMLVFEVNGATYPLGWALLLITWGAMIVDWSHSGPPRPRLTALLMALLAAGLAALWSGNVLTLLVSWAVYDLLWVCGYVAAEGSTQSAIRGLALNSLATLLLWSGAMFSRGGADNEFWPMMRLGTAPWLLWGLAGLLRLAIYPLHLAAPGDPRLNSPLAAPLLLSPILGWGLWLHLGTISGGPIAFEWIMWPAAISLGVGGLAAWMCRSPGRTLMWAGIGLQGAILLAAGLEDGSVAPIIIAGSLTWALGIAALFLGRVSRRDLLGGRILSAVGGLALLGLPLTSGFVVQSTLLGALTRENRAAWGSVALWSMVIGNLFLLPALVRYWRASLPTVAALPRPFPFSAGEEGDEREAGSVRWFVYHVLRVGQMYGAEISSTLGVGIVVVWPIWIGLSPAGWTPAATGTHSLAACFSAPGWAGWLLWVVVLLMGGLLAGWDSLLWPRLQPLLGTVYDLLCLEWLYDVLAGALNRGLALFRMADQVVGGAGALLWAWVLFLLFLLVRGAL